MYRYVVAERVLGRGAPLFDAGGSVIVGGDRGLFAGLDFRTAWVLHGSRGDTLAVDDGVADVSIDVFVVLGWTLGRSTPARVPATRRAQPAQGVVAGM